MRTDEGGGGDGRPDGLEIVSIGTPYSGPWNKKYWSSSRGKVRYPYPVGYHARRTYNGAMYKLEISEGPKGPLFMITSPDGNSCSAHTPDITWDKFQKKSCQKMQSWHEKRLSGKVDGIEFFGFKSPSVQRLLRELKSNVNETAEQSILATSRSNDLARGEHDDQLQLACKSPDLVVPDMEKPLVTGKRSKRTKTKAVTPSSVSRLKRPRRGRPGSSTDVVCFSVKEKHERQSSLSPSSFGSTGEPENCKLISTALPFISIVQDKNYKPSAVNGLTLQSRDDSNGKKDEMIMTLEERKLAGSEIYACIDAVNGLNIQGNIIDRSPDSKFRTSANGRDRDECIQDGTLCVPGDDLCAPDTLDSLEEPVSNAHVTSTRNEEKLIASETCISKRLVAESHPGDELDTRVTSPGIDKEELIVADTFMSEGVLSESHMENEMASGSSNGSSEKFDSDSVGQEIDKSMMTLLLPQAIPLLKKASNKKRKSNATVQNFVSSTKAREGNKATSGVHSPKIDHTKAVVLDSLENEQCEVGRQLVLLTDNAECEQSADGKDGRPPHSCDDLVNGDARKSDMGISVRSPECITIVGSPTGTGSQNSTPGTRKVYTRRKMTSKATNNGSPLSESTTCRTYEGDCEAGSMLDSEALDVSPSIGALEDRTSTGGELHTLQVEEITLSWRPKLDDLPICVSTEGEHASNMLLPSVPVSEETRTNCKDRLVEQNAVVDVHGSVRSSSNEKGLESSSGKEVRSNADLNIHRSFELDFNLEGIAEYVGCYIHPLPILHLWLSSQENEIYICALCGLQNKDGTVFLYKLARTGCPSFVGHTTVSWPPAVHVFGNVPPERSSFQLTPNGQLLVLHGSIKVPCCREGMVDCLCSTCKADSRSSSSVKILRVKLGYVSVLLELRTDEVVECILVCEPNHLVAAGESGRLHLWTMDTTWSTLKDQHTISTKDYYSPKIVELKSIPPNASLVVGHDGFEEFTLWDISKRAFIARFTGPGTSIYAFHPISRFGWPKREAHHSSSYNLEEHVNRMMEATKLSLNESSPGMDGEDIAIWLLVATNPIDHPTDPVGCWRLALMARNTLVLGTTLDPGAAAVATSGGNGIVGTRDGAVYMWDLSRGNRLGTLHHFKGGSVSCIATDDSWRRRGFLAAGSRTGELLVCRRL
ncbi:unnamed protein product [Linum trigynum]|uniref:FYR C-terminal domain-containing protein n=1 Tax=Linum trigynum TaxID=586398 RepID=A0AAV2FBJ4_9ROSI